MKNACLYIRVSTDNQVELSPDSQKRLLIEYCKKNKIMVTDDDIFMDLGISGKTVEKRPEFNRMIAICKSKKHPYDAIIVWKFSRFARNQEESIVYKKMLKKIGVEVISVSEPISDDIGGRIAESIFEIMDEYYSINLSQEVMRGMSEKASRGGYLGSQPYGYTNASKEDDKVPKIIPREADVVRYIYDKFVNANWGMGVIARELNKKGLKTRSNRTWNSDTIEYMIMNPFYIGKVRWNYCKHDSSRTINPEEEWIIADSKHEPIVDTEIWNKAQNKLKASRKPTNQRGKLPMKHWLSGILKCASCGSSINYHSRVERRNQSAYFQCRKKFNSGCYVSQYTIVPVMEENFINGLKAVVNSGNYVLVNREVEEHELNPIDYIQMEIDSLEKKLKKLNMAFLDDIYTDEEFLEIKTNILSTIEELEQKKANTSVEKTQNKKYTKEEVYELIDILKSDNISVELKNEALKKVVQKVVFSKENQTMDFYFWG